ncbi:MAG: DUF1385 domain-containing protein [Bacillota bacterium]
MRGPKSRAVAVRLASGQVHLEVIPGQPWHTRKAWYRWPLVRGVVGLAETLSIGIESLLVSANLSEDPDEHLGKKEAALAVGLAVVLAVGLFIVLPTVLISFLRRTIQSRLGVHLLEGLLRVTILTLYLFGVSRIAEIRRMLQYHGAEHQAIHALEQGHELDVAQVREFPLAHPRCGTSFLFVVVLVSVLLFGFFGWPSVLQRILLRLALLPVVAGISYELIRLAGKSRSPLARACVWPGLQLQRFTTSPPDDGQIQVAVAALKAVLQQG